MFDLLAKISPTRAPGMNDAEAALFKDARAEWLRMSARTRSDPSLLRTFGMHIERAVRHGLRRWRA